ncbi:hypothetical protein ACKVMT_14025 [Halobacteriales archaeon Cl-PHB]
MDLPDRFDGRLNRRRKVAILLVFLLVVLGAGIGTFALDPTQEDPPVIEATPVPTTPTPTETPGGPTPTATPSGTATPTTTTPPPTSTAPTPPTATVGTTATATATSSAGGGSDAPVSLETVGSSALMDYDALSPGDSGSESVVFRNGGGEPGRLAITNVTVDDAENGIVGPESDVDSTPNEGELSDHVMVVVTVEYENGTTQHLYDTDNGARSLAALANETATADAGVLDAGRQATLTFEWSLPSATGNEIQSDGATFAVDFQLAETS